MADCVVKDNIWLGKMEDVEGQGDGLAESVWCSIKMCNLILCSLLASLRKMFPVSAQTDESSSSSSTHVQAPKVAAVVRGGGKQMQLLIEPTNLTCFCFQSVIFHK